MHWKTRLAIGSPAAVVLVVTAACTLSPPLERGTVVAPGANAAVTQARIVGTVFTRGGDPSGIDVQAFPVDAAPGGKVYAARTDQAGHFSLALPAGTYNLVASREGSRDRAIRWAVQTATTVDLYLTPTGAIAGTVATQPATDPSGILVFVPGTSFIAAADSQGLYTLDAVPEGTVSVMVAAPGYAPAVVQSVAVQAGQTTYNTNLTLLPAGGDASRFAGVSGLPPGGQIGAKYVGASTCKLCHPEAFGTFSTTAHWTIRDNLSWSGRNNAGCRSCHSAGEDPENPGKSILLTDGAPAGFDFTKTWLDAYNEPFRGIQCENCHGPGGNHASAALVDKGTTITGVPSYGLTCVRCHTSGKFNQKWNGATDVDVNAGGGGAAPHHPQDLAYRASGGFSYGKTFPKNAHQTLLGNGCVNCHMAGSFPANHGILIDDGKIEGSCRKCHPRDFTSESITAYQAQIKLAAEALEEVLVEYRNAFCLEVQVATSSTQLIPYSTASVDIANLARKASTWDDSPASVSAGFPHQSGPNPTADSTSWSTHQTTFNRAYWNWDLIEADKSWGIHAPTYLQSLIRASYNDLTKDLPSSASYQVLTLP